MKIEGDWEKVVWYGPGGGEVHRTGLLVGVNNCEKWDKSFIYTIMIKSTQNSTQRALALMWYKNLFLNIVCYMKTNYSMM